LLQQAATTVRTIKAGGI